MTDHIKPLRRTITGVEYEAIQVVPGDTWMTLAEMFGTTPEHLKKVNHREPPKDRLHITDELWVPRTILAP